MGQSAFDFQPQRKIYSVSELSQQIRIRLEQQFPDVWVAGEISNYKPAGSGHCYFTLKDAGAQLRAVCFRAQARYLRFKPQDGMSVIARGRLSVYEARGEYQLLVELLEPAGVGALQLAFEQLKHKLAAEGLFARERKKPLPMLPRRIGVITSPSGAVIRDMIRVLRRRFANMDVLLYPVRVQGEGAAREIVNGIEFFNRFTSAPLVVRGRALSLAIDVLILARGGGSLEDLLAFNEEPLARAIAASAIPVISGVGHETDFTIADFVADLRAPTPSAAAELVVKSKQELVTEVASRVHHLTQELRYKLSQLRQQLTELRMHYVFEATKARVQQEAQQVDDRVALLDRIMRQHLADARYRCTAASAGVHRYDVRQLLGHKRTRLESTSRQVETAFGSYLAGRRTRLRHLDAILKERSPLGILERGYAIVRDESGGIIRDAADVALGSAISIRVARGQIGATVDSADAES
jgi:exodeoxyribonuclease VII large subunit